MSYKIRFASGVEFSQPEQATPPISPLPSGRTWRRIDVIGTVDEAKAAFVDGAQYAQVWDSVVTDVDEVGNEVETIVEESRDLSEWSVAGEIIDRQADGNGTAAGRACGRGRRTCGTIRGGNLNDEIGSGA